MKVVGFFILLCALLAGVLLWQVVAALPSRPPSSLTAAAVAPSATPAPPDAIVSTAPPTIERAPESADAPSAAEVRWVSDLPHAKAERALLAARQGLAAEPHHVPALRDELTALRSLERWSEADATLARLMELEPDNLDHAFERAGILLRQRRWVEAAALYRTVVEKQPQRSEAWFDLAIAQQAARRLSDACAAWDSVIALRPADLSARAHRAEVLLDLHEWAAAADDLRIVLDARPDDAEAALNLALALDRGGASPAALTCVQQALEPRPRDVRLLNRAAELSWKLSEIDAVGSGERQAAALDYWRRSLAADPSQRDIAERLSALQQ